MFGLAAEGGKAKNHYLPENVRFLAQEPHATTNHEAQPPRDPPERPTKPDKQQRGSLKLRRPKFRMTSGMKKNVSWTGGKPRPPGPPQKVLS